MSNFSDLRRRARRAHLTGLLLVAVAVIALDWATKAAAGTWLAADVIYNPYPPSPWLALVGAVSAVALCVILNRPAAALACGAVLGGGTANIISGVRGGQVLDFIPVPSWLMPDGTETNVADIALLAGLAFCVILLSVYFYRALARALSPE